MTFTAAIARDRPRAAVVYLVEIQTLASGPLLYLSDRNKVVGGLAYSDYIARVDGLGDTLFRATADFQTMPITITFRNDPYDDGSTAYGYLSALSEDHPLEGAAVAVKACYLDDDNEPATPETVFVGNLDSPRSITGISFVCPVLSREAYASQLNR